MATNPYYQRAFNAIGGTLARARQMVNEFALIQRGFDLIGSVTKETKYQCACSDLESPLETNVAANCFYIQRALMVSEVNAGLLEVSGIGPVTVQWLVNGSPLLATPLEIPQGMGFAALTMADSPTSFNLTTLPYGAKVVPQIVAPGTGAKGLTMGIVGAIEGGA